METPEPQPAVTPAAEPVQGGQPPAPKELEKKTLTQVEIDSIVEDRLKRDRQTREENLAKELGMPLKEAKAFLKAKKEAEEAEKSALEKANEKAAGLEKALKERDLRDLKRSKVESLISEKKIKLPEGTTIADVLDFVTGEDEDGINKGAGKLLKFFPFSAQAGAGSNPANPSGKEPNLEEQIKAAQAEALKTGNWDKYTQLCMKRQKG